MAWRPEPLFRMGLAENEDNNEKGAREERLFGLDLSSRKPAQFSRAIALAKPSFGRDGSFSWPRPGSAP
jgi:hypothetical protein